jgi:hypothetical protein
MFSGKNGLFRIFSVERLWDVSVLSGRLRSDAKYGGKRPFEWKRVSVDEAVAVEFTILRGNLFGEFFVPLVSLTHSRTHSLTLSVTHSLAHNLIHSLWDGRRVNGSPAYDESW